MNFREHFEAWHKKQYGYIGKYSTSSTHITYQTTACQERWVAWQACADWHTGQAVQQQMDVTQVVRTGPMEWSAE